MIHSRHLPSLPVFRVLTKPVTGPDPAVAPSDRVCAPSELSKALRRAAMIKPWSLSRIRNSLRHFRLRRQKRKVRVIGDGNAKHDRFAPAAHL